MEEMMMYLEIISSKVIVLNTYLIVAGLC